MDTNRVCRVPWFVLARHRDTDLVWQGHICGGYRLSYQPLPLHGSRLLIRFLVDQSLLGAPRSAFVRHRFGTHPIHSTCQGDRVVLLLVLEFYGSENYFLILVFVLVLHSSSRDIFRLFLVGILGFQMGIPSNTFFTNKTAA